MACGSDVLFTFDEVTVEVGGSRLLGPVIATIAHEGVTVVLGPSGAGKSTLLRLCNRLEVPTTGRVLFGDHDIATLDPLEHRRRVGMVFQRPTLFAGTVRDNLREAAPDADESAFVLALEVAGLASGFLDRPREELSGGEAQRACLARALMADPAAILMDEPTSSLDPDHRLGVEKLAADLARDGRPIVWVTHDLEQAERIADHRLVLVDGLLATDAQMHEFLRDREADGSEGGDDAGD
jgi:putative ABC transport system ATP-binding protein